MRRPTMSVLAKEAGVGLSTVDRVLNGRAPVEAATAQRVLEAAERIGYYATPLLRQRLKADVPQRTFGFLLQQRSTEFYAGLGEALHNATADLPEFRAEAVIEYMDDLTPAAVADALRRMGHWTDGIAVVAADHPIVSSAIEALAAESIPVVALISDLTAPSRAAYVGLDNRKVGRSAAWFLAQKLPRMATTAIMVGSHRYLCQEANEIGFRSFLREHAPTTVLLDPVATLESDHYACEAALDLVRRRRLDGIYVAGGGIKGVLDALRQVEPERRPVTIGHDLTEVTARGLDEGLLHAVLSHPVEAVARQAVQVLAQGAAPAGTAGHSLQHHLPLQIAIPESR